MSGKLPKGWGDYTGATALFESQHAKKPTPTTQTPVTVTPNIQTPVHETGVHGTPVKTEAEPPSMTPVVTQTPVTVTPVTVTPTTQTGVTEIPVPSEMWLNSTVVLNWVLDEFLPSLDHNAQAVMLRVLRLTLGFKRRNCLVSTGTLARKTRLSEQTITRVVKQLRADGYIQTKAVVDGSRGARGLEFVLNDRALPPEAVTRRTPTTQTPVRGTGVRRAPMKISEEYMERPPDAVAPAPVASILRKVAEQFRAGHPGADEGTVRERLSEFIRHEGWGEIDEATMSEALKPRAT